MTDNLRKAYEAAIVQVLRDYGSAIEAFGRASAESRAGMEKTTRLVKDVARGTLAALLGRDPTAEELEQIPPLHKPTTVSISMEQIVTSSAHPSRKKPRDS